MSLFTTSSSCRLAQSIRKSGNADTREFLILRIFPKSKLVRALASIETSKSDSPPPPCPIPISGQEESPERFHRAMLELISGKRALSHATYRTRFLRSSGRSMEFPHFFIHEFAFTKELLLLIPRLREPASPSEPSSLQPRKGFAATIQFPHGIRGEIHIIGVFPLTMEVPPKQAAIPMAPVIVGVIYMR